MPTMNEKKKNKPQEKKIKKCTLNWMEQIINERRWKKCADKNEVKRAKSKIARNIV